MKSKYEIKITSRFKKRRQNYLREKNKGKRITKKFKSKEFKANDEKNVVRI